MLYYQKYIKLKTDNKIDNKKLKNAKTAFFIKNFNFFVNFLLFFCNF